MNLSLKKISVLISLLYLLTGVYLAVNSGISHDEFHEQQNWNVNLQAIKSFFISGEYNDLLSYKDKYHGIGFHFFSQPIQFLFSDVIANSLNISEYGGLLISKHIATFLIFFISGLFLYKILLIIKNDELFALTSVGIYFTYPYLFGHSLFNPKDIPFLSVWIICTFYLIKILQNLQINKKINLKLLITLSFFTAFLVSIRTLGLIIFLQYLVFIIVYLEIKKLNTFQFIKTKFQNLLIFFVTTAVLIYLMNPILWHNPLELVKSVSWMGKYQQNVCTITLGNCMKALNLPASYYFIWLFFKLPILVIFGIFLFPFIENKLDQNKFSKIILISVLISILSILVLFIILNISLYDELRHIMFLIPLILITGFSFLYLFNRKIFIVLGSLTIIFFTLENININPYQYTWLNSSAKIFDINKNFETDYWGISNKNLSKKIEQDYVNKKFIKQNCIYGGQYAEVFLKKYGFKCFKSYSELDGAKNRPYYVIKNVRNVKRSNPKDCSLILNEKYNYILSKQEINLGSLWYCD